MDDMTTEELIVRLREHLAIVRSIVPEVFSGDARRSARRAMCPNFDDLSPWEQIEVEEYGWLPEWYS